MNFKCDICGSEVKYKGIPSHLRKHKLKKKDYFITEERQKHYEVVKSDAMIEIRKSSPFCKEFYDGSKYKNEDIKIKSKQTKLQNKLNLKEKLGDNYEAYMKSKNIERVKKAKDTELKRIMNENACNYSKAYEIYCKKRALCSPRTVEYWLAKGYNEIESRDKVSEWQSQTSPRTVEYWLAKGYNEIESRDKVSEWQDNKSTEYLRSRGLSDIEITNIREEARNKLFNTKLKSLGVSYEEFLEFKDDKQQYYKLVWFFTNKTIKQNYYTINNIEKRGYNYHIDHRYSIIEGFNNRVSPELVGSIHNLEIISREENRNKWKNCSITLDELIILNEK